MAYRTGKWVGSITFINTNKRDEGQAARNHDLSNWNFQEVQTKSIDRAILTAAFDFSSASTFSGTNTSVDTTAMAV